MVLVKFLEWSDNLLIEYELFFRKMWLSNRYSQKKNGVYRCFKGFKLNFYNNYYINWRFLKINYYLFNFDIL